MGFPRLESPLIYPASRVPLYSWEQKPSFCSNWSLPPLTGLRVEASPASKLLPKATLASGSRRPTFQLGAAPYALRPRSEPREFSPTSRPVYAAPFFSSSLLCSKISPRVMFFLGRPHKKNWCQNPCSFFPPFKDFKD